jgi:hypothetical protein
MTRYVLLVGLFFAALLTVVWLVFTVLPALPNTGIAPFDSILQTLRLFAAFNRYNDRTPFTGTGPLFQLWFVLLLISIAGDKFIKPAAKAAVSSFAVSMSPREGQVACGVTQDSSLTGAPTNASASEARFRFLMSNTHGARQAISTVRCESPGRWKTSTVVQRPWKLPLVVVVSSALQDAETGNRFSRRKSEAGDRGEGTGLDRASPPRDRRGLERCDCGSD